MKEYATVLLIAMPLFLVLITIEKIYGYYRGEDTAPLMDSVSSISSGIINSLKDVLGLSVTLLSYEWMAANLALFQQNISITSILIAFIVIDFYGYWSHRLAHQVNFFWNKHAIHHSSEEFNLSCALRQSISSFVNLFTFLLLPAAIVGVPAKVIAITLPIHLFLQFWYHTKHIKKMGILEKIIVTPSHHRVHHAINPEYMDKNHGQIFIFWDKLFGTFQEELDHVPAVFGITRPAQTWNPFRINFQHLWLLISDAWRADNWRDKLTIWFKPTGWRPANFEEKYPVNKINDVYNFNKYGTQNSKLLTYWSIIQMFSTLGLVTYLYFSIANLSIQNIFIYAIFIFISVYSYTELMDTNKYAIIFETIRFTYGVGIIFYMGNWFEIDQFILYGTYLVMAFISFSFFGTLYFVSTDFKSEKLTLA